MMFRVSVCLALFAATSGGAIGNPITNNKCDFNSKPPYYHTPPSGDEATKYSVAHGQLVLLGKVVFPPSYSCSKTPGFCGTHQIHFDVSCVLKGDGLPVAAEISIGDKPEDTCDLTLVPANLNGKELIVIVKRKPKGVNQLYNFDWHEVIPRASSYIMPLHLDLVMKVCNVQPSLPAFTSRSQACPSKPNDEDCYSGTDYPWIQVSNYGKYRISINVHLNLRQASDTCRAFGARLLYINSFSELKALLRALPRDAAMMWWTSGLLKESAPYWENYIYGYPISSDVISWPSNDSLPDGHLMMTSHGWVATNDTNQRRPFICKLAPDSDQLAFVPVEFSPEVHRLSFSYFMPPSDTSWLCCKWVKYTDKNVTSETLMTDMMQPYYMQHVPELSLVGPARPQKKKYTYMMVDVTDPNDIYVHYLLTNAGTSPSRDHTAIIDYQGPLPERMHHYLFLAFIQLTGTVYINPFAFSDKNCTQRPRCGFYMSTLMTVHRLQLAAVTPVTAEIDPYTVQKIISSRKMTTVKACKLKWPNLKEKNNNLICPSPLYTAASNNTNSAQQRTVLSTPLFAALIITYFFKGT